MSNPIFQGYQIKPEHAFVVLAIIGTAVACNYLLPFIFHCIFKGYRRVLTVAPTEMAPTNQVSGPSV